MTNESAIKKASKFGEVKNNGNRYRVEFNNHVVSWIAQSSGNITCINVRWANDISQIESDYSAGVYVRNLTSALKMAC